MSVCPENFPYLDRAKPDIQEFSTESVFYFPRMVDKRPWLAHAFTELLQVQRRGTFEQGIGDFRVSDETLNMAGRILGCIRYRSLPTPSLSVLPGGGIQISWANGPDAVEVSVFPGEGVGVARLVDDAPTKVRELGAAEYGELNNFLADFVG
jgi:hypothetical protein